MLLKTRFSSSSKLMFLLSINLIGKRSTANEVPINVDKAIASFSSIRKFWVTEKCLPLKNNSLKEQDKEMISELPIIKKMINVHYVENLKDKQHKEYQKFLYFLCKLVKEFKSLNPLLNVNSIDSLGYNQLFELKNSINFNGKNNVLYTEFDHLIRNNLDYTSSLGWLTNYTYQYNLQGSYSIEKLNHPFLEEEKIILKVEPVPFVARIRTSISEAEIVFTFKNINDANDGLKKEYILEHMMITTPHLLIGTDMHKIIKDLHPKSYEKRNMIKTCIFINFSDKEYMIDFQ